MNERLNEINGELKQLNEALARQSQLEAQLKDLQEQRAEREQRVMDTSRVFWEEQEDVDKLEKGGLRSLLLSITGDKEARLSQERREALAAKLQYDQARRDLEDIDGRIRAVLGEKVFSDARNLRSFSTPIISKHRPAIPPSIGA